jgi:hypothetical protein
LAGLLLPAVLCLAGCRGGTPMGQVAGKVTFQGKPVSQGRVSFQNPATGASDEALLNNDGTFAVESPLPVGEYKVMVMPLVVREKADPRGPVVGVERPAPDIPEKYRTIGTTDLKATVKEGKNDIPLEMKR